MLRDLFDDGARGILGFAHGPSSGKKIAWATPQRKRAFPALAAALATLALGACTGPLSTLEPAGPAAQTIATLWWVMLWGSVPLFVLVVALFALVYLRPGFGSTLSPAKWMVYGGIVMPVVILTGLVGYALFAGERLLPVGEGQPHRIEARSAMWFWEFHYPQIEGAAPTSVLHIPAGEPVDILVTTTDVIHSFWVPRLAGKIDAIPGHENVVRIQADRPGLYHGVCAEFCGDGHTDMRFAIEAHEGEAFAEAVLAGDAR